MHTFEPRDVLHVITPHGLGVVLYITAQGIHTNDIWCVAHFNDGQIYHYETKQLKLAPNATLGVNL